MPPIVEIHDPADPRIAAYTRMKERDLSREGDRFIAESETVVRRLLASPVRTESLLVASHKLESLLRLAPDYATVFTAPAAIVNQIIGFKFHSGVMACAVRPASPSIAQLASRWSEARVNLMVCPQTNNTDN